MYACNGGEGSCTPVHSLALYPTDSSKIIFIIILVVLCCLSDKEEIRHYQELNFNCTVSEVKGL